MIVGRNPEVLDSSAVSRAAIESLAENFSDGVVAPAFWYAIFGLPGLIAYKMINTADSMIGYHNQKYEFFGKVAAQIDDGANWVPARISAFLIAAGALGACGGWFGKSGLGNRVPGSRSASLAQCRMAGIGNGRSGRVCPWWSPALSPGDSAAGLSQCQRQA